MNIRNNILIFALLLNLSSCKDVNKDQKLNNTTQSTSSDLELDHFNIWVKNPTITKQKLIEIGFTAVPDSLSQIHEGQGTAGRYFHFLNGYLELIFVNDQNELERNVSNNENLDFTERAEFDKNGASPFSIALKIKNYDVEKIPFDKVLYHQKWMKKKSNIVSAKNSKKFLKEPSIFVVYPEIESDTFETLSDLKNISDEYAFVRGFYKHSNGAKKITNIVIMSTDLNVNTKTIHAINGIENLTVKNGTEHLMQLYFDNNIQGKTFDLRPELPLIVYL